MSLLATLSAEELQTNYLLAAPRTLRNGQPISADIYTHHLRSAVAYLARVLDLDLTGNKDAVYDESFDSIDWDGETWVLKQTEHRPVRSIEKFSYKLGDFPEREIPTSWIHISSKTGGQIQLIPGQASLQYLGPLSHWWSVRPYQYVPLAIRVKLKAGFAGDLHGSAVGAQGQSTLTVTMDTDYALPSVVPNPTWLLLGGTAVRVNSVSDDTIYLGSALRADYSGRPTLLDYPEDMRTAAYLLAAPLMLEQLGALLYGPGVTSAQLGMDALSQGRGISAGKGFGPYSALIERYKERAQAAIDELRASYGVFHMTFI